MSALPDPDRQPDPRERKPNRAVGGDPERQRDLSKPWMKAESGDIHRRVFGRTGPTRAQVMRQRRKGR